MRRAIISLLAILTVTTVDARLGETPIQFADRYGKPIDAPLDKHPSPFTDLVEGATHHTYEYQGWRIRAAFLQLDGPAVRVAYQKIITAGVNPSIQDYELQAIMTANTPAGMSWKAVPYRNPDIQTNAISQALAGAITGEKMWQRTDGAILWLRSNLIAQLELPVARQHEAQLKAGKEQKARASVPKF